MYGNKAAYQLLRMPDGANLSETSRDNGPTRAYRMGRGGKVLDADDLPMQRVARLDQQVIGEELDVYFDDGSTVHLLGNAAPLHDDHGNIAGAVGVFMDITYRTEYEHHLKALAAELERSNKDLQQFAYIVSHDLQEPLRQVVRFSEILHQRYQDRLDQAAKEFLNFIIEGGKRMQRLIKDLLAYSKVERGQPELVSAPMEELLETAMLNMTTSIRTSRAEVTHGPLPVLKVDRVQLLQVFQNLLSNAIKFRGPEPPKIHVAASREGKTWVFSVQDNGIGFDPKAADTLFELFRQLPTKAKKKGTGIGLAIVKRVVETHGGRVWAESKPGKGATFYFTLPAA
jgi:light-regulated signal transduction histidine kinase (bacteriophytochrome)